MSDFIASHISIISFISCGSKYTEKHTLVVQRVYLQKDCIWAAEVEINQYVLSQLYLCYTLSLPITVFALRSIIVNKVACLKILPLETCQCHEKTS